MVLITEISEEGKRELRVGRQGGKSRREGNRKKRWEEGGGEKKDLKYFKASGFPLNSVFKFQKYIVLF